MNAEFGAEYARNYDALYGEKDYAGECDLIERVVHAYGGTLHSILDLGCGTGTHAMLLARRGYDVVAVDRSAWMVAEAQKKTEACEQLLNMTVVRGDIRSLDLQRRFDLVVMMFGVLGYQEQDADLRSAVRTARSHLQPGGLLLVEAWFGPAVLRQRPSSRVKTVPIPGGQVRRSASAQLDEPRHLCTVRFHVQRAYEAEQVETEEVHRIRYFFPEEIEAFLQSSGFSLVRIGAFPAFDQDPDDSTWNVLAVARAV